MRELVDQRLLDVDALGADARLARVDERGEERTVERALEIRVGEDDHRILPPELEHHRNPARSGGGRDAASDADRPGEEHLRDPWIADDGLAERGFAVRDLHEPCRRAGLLEYARHPLGGERRELRRLEHDAVSSRDRCCHIGKRNRERDVPRRDRGDDAEGLVHEPRLLRLQVQLLEAHSLVAQDARRLPRKPGCVVDGGVDLVRDRFGARFRGLGDDNVCDLVGADANDAPDVGEHA